MSGESPAAVLFDENGVAVAVAPDVETPDGTKALLVAGEDAQGIVRLLQSHAGALRIEEVTGTLGSILEELVRIREAVESMAEE